VRIATRLGAIALLLSSSAAWAGAPAWTISESSGPVSVGSRGAIKIGTRGNTLSVGDTVTTGPGGRAVIVRGGEYLVLAPNTRLRVADPAQSSGLMQIIEEAGNILFRINKKTTPHFGVQTPYLAAVVKGTTFSVTVTPAGSSVQVVEGKVEVATNDGGARYLVLPGDIGAVSATHPGRLEVKGRETKTIQSTVTAPSAPGSTFETPGDAAATETSDGRIEIAVPEKPVSLATVTSGLVGGALAQPAVATVRPLPPVETVIEATPVASSPPVTVASVVVAPGAPDSIVDIVDPVPVTAIPPVDSSPPAAAPTDPDIILVASPPPEPVVSTPPVTPPSSPVNVVVASPLPAPVAAMPPAITLPVTLPPVVVADGSSSNGSGNSGSGNNGNGTATNGNGSGGNGSNGNGRGGNGNGNGGGDCGVAKDK
jgi:collagen type III alpha